MALMANLQNARAALQKGRGGDFHSDPTAFQRFRVENGIYPRQFHGSTRSIIGLAAEFQR
jgi:hypothetical protein